MTVTRPIMRYHGGKWELAPWIISHFPAHRVYCEPFGGAASVLLRKPRAYAEIYNDKDGDVVNLFSMARDRGDDLIRAVALTPYARDEFDLAYVPAEDPVERARRLLIRSCMGHGGNVTRLTAGGTIQRTGFRLTTENAGANCARIWGRFPAHLRTVIQRLQGVIIENRDAKEVMTRCDGKKTLIYADPPYVASTRDAGGDYRHEMDDPEHRDLARFLHGLEAAVIVSGYHSPLYDEIYAGWERVECAAQADGAKPRVEVLWMRNVDLGLLKL